MELRSFRAKSSRYCQRGKPVTDLFMWQLWHHGFKFLCKPEKEWPLQKNSISISEDDKEILKDKCALVSQNDKSPTQRLL